MKKVINLLLFFLLFLNNSTCFALSGVAQLSGQSNHSGIKIKFVANSSTAVTDSASTDAAGNYAINLAGGIYLVQFSMNGYQTYIYNNGFPLALPNNTVLASATLFPGSAVYVSGNVSGQWISNTTYIVNGNLTIPTGSSLVIPPGTSVKFLGNFSLTANGALNAIGTAAKPIIFEPADSTKPWGQMELKGGPNYFEYCVFKYYHSIVSNQVQTTVRHCTSRNSFWGFLVYGGTALLESNTIINAEMAGISGGIGPLASTATISCNKISSPKYKITGGSGAFSRGLHINGSELVIDNEVFDCQQGLYVYSPAISPVIRNNYLHHNNFFGIGLDETWAPLVISNNTIDHNQFGIYSYHPHAILTNNAITTATYAIAGKCNSIDHNLIFNCVNQFSLSTPITGLGQVVTTNSNGDPIDSYFNLFIDPLYSSIPLAQSGSPLFNAGNSTYNTHIGMQTISGCGSFITSLKRETADVKYSVYPNPTSGDLMINAVKDGEVRLLDAAGRMLLRETLQQGANKINLEHFDKGIYFVRLVSGEQSQVVKIVKD